MNRKDVVASFFNCAVSGQIRVAYDKFVSPNFRHHNAYYKGDRESLLVGMEENHARFPNKTFSIRHILEDGDLVATYSKVQLNPEMREMAVVHIFRFEGEDIVELWDVGQEIPGNSPNENGAF